MLLGFVIAASLAVVAVAASGILVEEEYPEPPTMEVEDKPLLTEQEKEWARRGYPSYTDGDYVYIDPDIPSEYYEE